MKILHIITGTAVGGAERQLQYLISAADRERFTHLVLLPRGSAAAPLLRSAGAKIIEEDIADRSFSPKDEATFRRVIREIRPDVVHTHSSASGRRAACAGRVPVRIMTKHCSDPPPRFVSRFPVRQFCSIHWRRTLTRAVATDESAAAALIDCGMPSGMIKLIYNGSPEPEVCSPEATEALRRGIGIPEGAFTVGYFGRLERIKGPRVLLEAAALCLGQTRDVAFIVCGTGSEEKELRETAERFGISDRVFFCGFVDDPSPYMSVCRVIVSPSLGTETSSLSLCEGLSRGLVPVVSDVGGSARLIGGSGKVVPPDDAPALSDAIMELARDPGLVSILSDRARRRYRERCTALETARLTHLLYEEEYSRAVSRKKR